MTVKDVVPCRRSRAERVQAEAHALVDVSRYVDAAFINVRDLTHALQKIEAALRSGIGFSFFTMNLDHLCKLQTFPSFRRLYEQADFVSADGWPVALLARRPDTPIARATGADLVHPVCEMAARAGYPIFLFGSAPDVLRTASAKLCELYPGLLIAGELSPPRAFDPRSDIAQEAAQAIAASGARICFIALGAPTQEAFAEFSKATCPSVGFLCVGAAIDFIAGAQTRAPKVLRLLGLEWAWRWGSSPRRLTARYILCVRILADLIRQRMMPSRRH